MRTKTIQSSWPAVAAALGLAIGAALCVASVARAVEASSQAQPPAVAVASTAQPATDFVCNATPGGWCDLRDWSGMDRWPTTLQSQLPN